MPRTFLGGHDKLSAQRHKAGMKGEEPVLESTPVQPSKPIEGEVRIEDALDNFSYKELQQLAKDHEVKASGTIEEIRERLRLFFRGI